MMLKQLIGAEGQSSVCPAIVIAELDFVLVGGKSFDNRTDLAAQQAMVSNVFEQRNHR
jgi:hypothetical protein